MVYQCFSVKSSLLAVNEKLGIQDNLDGRVVELLSWAQVMILGSWDRVLHQASHREPASPSAYVSASLSLCVSHE